MLPLLMLGRNVRLAILLAALIALLPAAVLANRDPGPELTKDQERKLGSEVRRFMTEQRVPGGSVAISVRGKLVWSRGFGLADVEDGARAGPATMYRTASMGKPMTATIAFILRRQGKLDFEAPVQQYCPRYPQKPWPVRVKDLISHTSGIREPNDTDELYNTRHFDQPSDAVDLFARDPLRFEPGTDFGYTTWGYVLLGCVLEGATKEPLQAIFDNLLFRPAGMTQTRMDDPRTVIPGRSRGYAIENRELKIAPWTDMSHKLAAGGWITNASDMLSFMNAWMSGKLVDSADRTTMLTPYRLSGGSTADNYGMGWFIDTYKGRRFAFHGGGTPGISAIELMVPDRNVAVIGFFNLQDIKAKPRVDLATHLAEIVHAF